jgi:hypothetical protein
VVGCRRWEWDRPGIRCNQLDGARQAVRITPTLSGRWPSVRMGNCSPRPAAMA